MRHKKTLGFILEELVLSNFSFQGNGYSRVEMYAQLYFWLFVKFATEEIKLDRRCKFLMLFSFLWNLWI
ncbi:hypothetical protein IJ00_24420 [Calothrix sp. 336/3]|nr:hypothetical protein IJ00_24420 [Calothrix sp. 336/3]